MAIRVLGRRIIPALAFADASTDVLDCGTGGYSAPITTGTAQMASGSTLCLVRPTAMTGADRHIWGRFNTGAGLNSFRQLSSGRIRRVISTSGTGCDVQAAYDAISTYQLDQWCLIGATWNVGGATIDQKIFHGNALRRMQEATSYAARNAGTGTPQDDSGISFRIGSRNGANEPFAGRIHTVLIIRDYRMTLREFQEVGEMMLAQVPLHNAIPGIGAAGLWYPGRNGIGTVYDESVEAKHGTITGCAVAEGPPIPKPKRRFFALRAAPSTQPPPVAYSYFFRRRPG